MGVYNSHWCQIVQFQIVENSGQVGNTLQIDAIIEWRKYWEYIIPIGNQIVQFFVIYGKLSDQLGNTLQNF